MAEVKAGVPSGRFSARRRSVSELSFDSKSALYNTPKVLTNIYFDATPVSKAMLIFQSKPRGSSVGAMNFPI